MKGDQPHKLSDLRFLSILACSEADKGSGNFSFQYKRSAGRNLGMNSLLVPASFLFRGISFTLSLKCF